MENVNLQFDMTAQTLVVEINSHTVEIFAPTDGAVVATCIPPKPSRRKAPASPPASASARRKAPATATATATTRRNAPARTRKAAASSRIPGIASPASPSSVSSNGEEAETSSPPRQSARNLRAVKIKQKLKHS